MHAGSYLNEAVCIGNNRLASDHLKVPASGSSVLLNTHTFRPSAQPASLVPSYSAPCRAEDDIAPRTQDNRRRRRL